MSGTNASFPFPTTLGTLPGEGAKYVSLIVNLNTVATPPLSVNLLSQFQSGRFSTVQSVLVDNSTNGNAVSVKSVESGQTVHVPPFTLGRYPLLCGPSPDFLVWQTGLSHWSGTVGLFFINLPGGLFETRLVPQPLAYCSFSFALASSTPILVPLGLSPDKTTSILSIDLSLYPFSSPPIANYGSIELYEQATGGLPNTGAFYVPLWSSLWTVAAGANAPFYTRQVTFPGGLLQQYAGNPIWIVFIPFAGAQSATGVMTMTYSPVVIA